MKKTLSKLDFETYAYDEEGQQTIRISDTLSSIAFVGNRAGLSNDIQNQLTEIAHIGTKIEKLDDYCCTDCTRLSNANVRSNVKLFGDYAFTNCSALTSIGPFEESFPIYSIGKSAFENTGLQNVILNMHGRTYTKDDDYQGCRITTPDDGPYVGDYAFKDCKSLESVTFDKATELGVGMFKGCSELTSVKFNSNFGECVGERAFEDCVKLQSIHFPERWEMISQNMFKNCNSLTSITFDDKPETQPMFVGIEDYAFSNCTSLTSIVVPESVNSFEAFTTNAFAESSIKNITFSGIEDSTFDSYKSQDDKYVISNIDSTTTADFKYGQWYRNHASYILEEAVKNEIPVFMYITGLGCGFCSQFRSNTFNKVDFQQWCLKAPYFLSYTLEHTAVLSLEQLYYIGNFINGRTPKNLRDLGVPDTIPWTAVYNTFVILMVFWFKDGQIKVAKQWRTSGYKDESKSIPELVDGLLKAYVRDDKFNNTNYTAPIYRKFNAWGIGHDCDMFSKTGTKYKYDAATNTIKKST